MEHVVLSSEQERLNESSEKAPEHEALELSRVHPVDARDKVGSRRANKTRTRCNMFAGWVWMDLFCQVVVVVCLILRMELIN